MDYVEEAEHAEREIKRLRKQIAAKDAEIARLREALALCEDRLASMPEDDVTAQELSAMARAALNNGDGK